MNISLLKSIMRFLPILAILYVGYQCYDFFYSFKTSPDSQWVIKQAELKTIQDQNTQLETKLKEREEFRKSLGTIIAEIRRLMERRNSLNATLSDTLEIPEFFKMTTTEAQKVGINVQSVAPTARKTQDYYVEQPFDLRFKGVFVQVLLFLDRLSNVSRLVRVDNFSLRPIGPNTARYVELEGVLEIKTYQYRKSEADDVTVDPKTGGGVEGASQSGASAAKSPSGGGR